MVEITAEKLGHIIADKCIALGITDTSQLKLQKLVFLVLAFYGVLYDKKLFRENPLAWKKGPIFKSFSKSVMLLEDGERRRDIPIKDEELRYSIEDVESEKIKDVIEGVVSDFGKMSAEELVEKTHTDIWQEAHNSKSQIMVWEKVITYYKNNLLELVIKKEDKKAKVFTVTSSVIPGLILEYESYKDFITEIQEIASEIIKDNILSATN